MSARTRRHTRQYGVALRTLLLLTLLLGLVYPLAITALGQLALPQQANGSLISARAQPASAQNAVGSSLIGQSFTDAAGRALPEWFQPRPSAAGDGYDAAASGGSNLGPENPDLVALIEARRSEVARFEGIAETVVPADAVTASASGLDAQISPVYALLQVPRVAAARQLGEAKVRALVESMMAGRDLGYLGEPTVNVLQLNIAVAAL